MDSTVSIFGLFRFVLFCSGILFQKGSFSLFSVSRALVTSVLSDFLCALTISCEWMTTHLALSFSYSSLIGPLKVHDGGFFGFQSGCGYIAFSLTPLDQFLIPLGLLLSVVCLHLLKFVVLWGYILPNFVVDIDSRFFVFCSKCCLFLGTIYVGLKTIPPRQPSF